MKKFFLEFFIFTVSSIFSLLPLQFENSINLQRIITLIIVLLLIFSYKLFFSIHITATERNILKGCLIFFTTLLIQFSVINNGGFYSPFFVLLHIYSLALGFFVGLRASLMFLGFSVISLFAQIYTNQSFEVFMNDPGTILLYALSFMVIIPFSHFVAKQYSLKASLADVLSKQVSIDNSIISGISEMVIITDLKLKVLSINDQVERTLALSRNEIVGQSLLEVLFLKTNDGPIIKEDFLSVDRVIAERTTRIVKGLSLYTKNRGVPKNVKLTLKPVTDPNGTLEQITILISEEENQIIGPIDQTFDVTGVQLKHQAMIEDLKNKLLAINQRSLSAEVYLIANLEEDLVLSTELEQKIIHPAPIHIDIAQLVQKTVSKFQNIASLFNLNATFSVLNFSIEDVAPHIPKGLQLSPMDFTSVFFTAPVDVKWFTVLVDKLLFVGLLFGLGNNQGTIAVTIERYDTRTLRVSITIPTVYLTNTADASMIFKKDYGNLSASSSFGLASGLEGLLAEKVAKSINVPISSTFDAKSKTLVLSLYVTKEKVTPI